MAIQRQQPPREYRVAAVVYFGTAPGPVISTERNERRNPGELLMPISTESYRLACFLFEVIKLLPRFTSPI